MLKVYLAGPEVFLPGGRELIERKRALSTRYGFTPSPLHADLTPTASASPLARGIEISRLNEERMREADVCIANLTPFRGVSADPGTVYELGYMAAEGKCLLSCLFSGTGSYPPECKGWHFNMRLIDNQPPINNPCDLNAFKA